MFKFLVERRDERTTGFSDDFRITGGYGADIIVDSLGGDVLSEALGGPGAGRQSHHARLRSEPENDHRCDEPDLKGCQYQKLLAVRSAGLGSRGSMEDADRASRVGSGQADRCSDLSDRGGRRGNSIPRRGTPVRTGTRDDIARTL